MPNNRKSPPSPEKALPREIRERIEIERRHAPVDGRDAPAIDPRKPE